MTTLPPLLPADIVLVRGTSLVSRLIRWATRSAGEMPTRVNHVGIMVSATDIVESLDKTRQHPFSFDVPTGTYIYIMRRVDLTPEDRATVARKAVTYVGRSYGWLKIVAHALDHILFFDRYVARRLCRMDAYPICSWVVAYAYDEVGVRFGVPPNAASPDDIYDAIADGMMTGAYERVWPLDSTTYVKAESPA